MGSESNSSVITVRGLCITLRRSGWGPILRGERIYRPGGGKANRLLDVVTTRFILLSVLKFPYFFYFFYLFFLHPPLFPKLLADLTPHRRRWL